MTPCIKAEQTTLSARPSKRVRRALLGTTGLVAAHLFCGAFAPACAEDTGGSTTGKRLTLTTNVTIGPEAKTPFTNAYGWTVALSKAYLAVGPIFYFNGAPFTARLETPLPQQLLRWATIPQAFAHPGHYVPGDALGEVKESSTVDLLANVTKLGTANAVSGTYRSARFSFGVNAAGPLTSTLDGHVVVVEGTATKGAETRIFQAHADATDVPDSAGEAVVEGCVFEEKDIEDDGIVTFLVKPNVWFDQVDFETMPVSADNQPVPFESDGLAQKAFTRGLEKGTGYVFSYTPRAME